MKDLDLQQMEELLAKYFESFENEEEADAELEKLVIQFSKDVDEFVRQQEVESKSFNNLFKLAFDKDKRHVKDETSKS